MDFEFEVIRRKRRKSVGVQVTPAGEVKVLIPWQCAEAVGVQFLAENEQWVRRQLAKFEMLRVPEMRFVSGERVWYLGEELRLCLLEDRLDSRLCGNEVGVDGGAIFVFGEDVKSILLKWYRARAEDILIDRAAVFSEEMGVRPKNVRVRSQRTRWGSCSSLGNVNFNWRLVMAPLEVMDYVVIHELAHLKHMDHSKAFWGFVEQFDSGFREKKGWLKRHQPLLLGGI